MLALRVALSFVTSEKAPIYVGLQSRSSSINKEQLFTPKAESKYTESVVFVQLFMPLSMLKKTIFSAVVSPNFISAIL